MSKVRVTPLMTLSGAFALAGMLKSAQIGIVGDYGPTIFAHQAIPIALVLTGYEIRVEVTTQWVPTEEIQNISAISQFDGLWCAPGSP